MSVSRLATPSPEIRMERAYTARLGLVRDLLTQALANLLYGERSDSAHSGAYGCEQSCPYAYQGT
jgi:hypothetical protein